MALVNRPDFSSLYPVKKTSADSKSIVWPSFAAKPIHARWNTAEIIRAPAISLPNESPPSGLTQLLNPFWYALRKIKPGNKSEKIRSALNARFTQNYFPLANLKMLRKLLTPFLFAEEGRIGESLVTTAFRLLPRSMTVFPEASNPEYPATNLLRISGSLRMALSSGETVPFMTNWYTSATIAQFSNYSNYG